MSVHEHEVRLSEHPRAMRQIEAARGGGAAGAFAICLLLSVRAGLPLFDAGVRSLVVGIATFVIVWALAVQVWRHLAVAELQAARRQAMERRTAAGRPLGAPEA